MSDMELMALCKGAVLLPGVVADYIQERDESEYGLLIAKQLRGDGGEHLVAMFAKGYATYGECQCDSGKPPCMYRRNTAYVDEQSNYSFACEECRDEDNRLMQEQWDEYYSMVR